MRALLIAEKPSLMRDIQKVYNTMGFPDEITFMALAGHILTLQNPVKYQSDWGKPWRLEVLPMIPDKFINEVIEDKKSLYRSVKSEIDSGKYDYLINACDAGREGELIFYKVIEQTGTKIPVKRFWASDTTDETVKKALNNLIDERENSLVCLKASAKYRDYFDWLLGMNLSRAISLKSKTLIPVGRVMTPTLKIIVDRELEIQNFKPQSYWEIEADFSKYKGTWFERESNETRFFDKAKAQAIIDKLGKEGQIVAVNKKQEKNFAPTLHSLLELQKDANRYFGYTADKTLEIAQSLYEKRKLLSYPRTESRYLPKNMVTEIPTRLGCLKDISDVKPFLDKIFADPNRIKDVLSTKKYVDDKKVTDHHAIIPTAVKPKLEDLSTEEFNVYMLVVKRFISIFLDPYVVDKTLIVTKVDNEFFKTIGKTIVDLGYKALYKGADKDEEEAIVPDVKKGEAVKVNDVKLKSGQTTAPKRYDDASLLQAMQNAGKFIDDQQLQDILKETAGLGTSATRAQIITKLVGQKMIERKGKLIFATNFGIQIILTLKDKDIVSPELTAKWEIKLSEIEQEKYDIRQFYNEMIEYTKRVTQEFINLDSHVSNFKDSEVIGKCPKCGEAVVEGKDFYFCTNYKKTCDFIVGKKIGGATIPKTEVKKILTRKETKEFEFTWRSGKKGKARLGLDENNKVAFVFNQSSPPSKNSNGSSSPSASENADKQSVSGLGEVVGKCPKCGKDVVVGKEFYVCKSYPDSCDFNLKKIVNSGNITVEDAKTLLKGEKTRVINFVWKSGKPGTARLYFQGTQLKFDFT